MLKYKLRKLGRKKVIFWSATILIFLISMTSIIRYYAVASFANANTDSYVDNNVVFINDLDADYNYYMGLNYTEITDRHVMPGERSTGKYTDDNLVAVQLTYDSRDIENPDIYGTVSSNGERQTIYKYLKYYPVNSNGTVTIELIDNPFQNRPTGKGFNGWVCNPNGEDSTDGICDDSVFSYDNDYYTRYITVSAEGGSSISLYLNASWTQATIARNVNQINTNLKNKTMQPIEYESDQVYLTYQTLKVDYDYNFDQERTWNGLYFYGDISQEPTDDRYHVRWNQPTNSYTGGYQVLVYLIYQRKYEIRGPGSTCDDWWGCYYWEMVDVYNAEYDPDQTYSYIQYGNVGAVAINDDELKEEYFENTGVVLRTTWVDADPIHIGEIAYPPEYNLESYYYKTGALSETQRNSGLYYSNYGISCSVAPCSGNTDNNAGYKLIQHSDDNLFDFTPEYANINLSEYQTYIEGQIVQGATRIKGCNLANGDEVECKVSSQNFIDRLNSVRYLATRDTNIVSGNNLNVSYTYNKPFTLENGTYSATSVGNDLAIVNSTISNSFNADFNNVKIGRNVNGNSVNITGGSNNNGKMKIIVESGTYDNLNSKGTGAQDSTEGIFIYGSDYDRAKKDDSKLTINYSASASKSSGNATNPGLIPSSAMIVKSGTFGTSAGNNGNSNTGESYYTKGIYVGSWEANTTNTALRTLVVEGGRILNINGGPCVGANAGNAIGIYVKGGTISNIVGGAGQTQTNGNRIISITGGHVTNSVAGGSNGNVNSGGAMSGDTLVYIGGNATIGYKPTDTGVSIYGNWASSTFYQVIKGSVYGAGLGQQGSTADGRVNNSHVIINGGNIYGSVFGGGNYGSVGTGSSNPSIARIDILGGTIEGSVYGASNQAGAGRASSCNCGSEYCLTSTYYYRTGSVGRNSTIPNGTLYSDDGSIQTARNGTRCRNSSVCYTYAVVNSGSAYNPSVTYYNINANVVENPNTCNSRTDAYSHNIYINMSGGNVNESVYGGSNQQGDVYGSSTLNMTGGSVTKDVFGGGMGQNTTLRGNVELTVDESFSARDIYGGSALGRVNGTNNGTGTSNFTTNVNIKNGEVRDVYGCGMGQSGQNFPYTNGQSTVTMEGGSARYVYGGNNASGIAAYPTKVELLGGTISKDAYGGGNNVGHDVTNIHLDGTTVEGSVYGGSNNSGTVNTTNVTIDSGIVTDVFGGGNNAPSGLTKVIFNEANINGDVYGSGNKAQATTTNVTINSGDLNNVYGGGKNANAGTSNVLFKTGNASEVFGGSNASGIVTNSYVYISEGSIENVYGGNNIAGNTVTSHVYIGKGTLGTVYGGGKLATTTSATNVYVYGGTMDDVFGGGSEADVSNDSGNAATNVYVYGGTSTNVYGGSNTSGHVSNANVTIQDTPVACTATTPATGIVANPCYAKQTRNVTDVFGGNNAGGSVDNTIVNLRDTTNVRDVFGGGNNAKVLKTATVNMYSGTVRNVYGGGNKSFVGDATELGGAYASGTTPGNTYVNIANGTVTNNVYGSSNASFVYGDTHVYIGDIALSHLGTINNHKVTINGSVFGGSETNATESSRYDDAYEGVHGNSHVYVGAAEYNNVDIEIKGSLFGSGNNSKTSDDSYIFLNEYGTMSSVKSLGSIQRSKYVYLTNSVLELRGERDRALLTKYLYGLIRIENFYVLGQGDTSGNLNGTTLHMNAGTAFLSSYHSGTMASSDINAYSPSNFLEQTTDIGDDGEVVNTRSDNKLFMHTNVVFSVTKEDKAVYTATTDAPGPVVGMTYLGMYIKNGGAYTYGIYDKSYTAGADISEANSVLPSSAYTFVYGHHDYPHEEQIVSNGFYSHYKNEEDENVMDVKYVDVTPYDGTTYYKWILGEEPLDINVSLQATKSTVEGAHVETINLDELKELSGGSLVDWRDATMEILSVDTTSFGANSEVKVPWDTMLVDKTQIPTVAESSVTIGDYEVTDANRYFALSVGTTTSGWLNNYKTNIYDNGSALDQSRNFCLESGGDCTGNNVYQYDSTSIPRSLSFWLYYSKNLDFDLSTADEDEEIVIIPLGQVYVYTEFTNPHGDPTSTDSVRRVRIVVDISMVDNKTEKYAASISAGKKYEMFEKSSAAITGDGAVSIYQMLSVNLKSDEQAGDNQNILTANRLYAKEDTTNNFSEAYRYLKSDYLFPVGTKLTMIDLKNNEEYYYEVTPENRNDAIPNYEASFYQYRLEDFIKMGNTDSSNVYEDDMNGTDSTKYFTKLNDDGSGIAVEEFIFMVDFAGVEEHDNAGNHYLYMEIAKDIVDSHGDPIGIQSIMYPIGEPMTDLRYSIIEDVNTALKTDGYFVNDDGEPVVDDDNKPEKIDIYKKNEATLELNTDLVSKDANGNTVVINDTKFDDFNLGAKISIKQARKDDDGNPVYEDGKQVYDTVTTNLFGTVVTINGHEYYPQTDGSIRLTMAGRLTSVTSDIELDFSNSNLEYGSYKLVVETFASYDGLYYGSFSPTVNEFYFTLLNDDYGIDVSLPPVEVTRDSNNGQDKNGSLELNYTLRTKNGLANPKVKVHLERRVYGSNKYDTSYVPVSLSGIATSLSIDGGSNVLDSCFASLDNGDCYIYNLVDLNNNLEEQEFSVNMTMKEGPDSSDLANPNNAKWKSGTYRVVFDIYDGNTPIGSVYEYLIIRSLDVDEEIEGS